MLTKIYLLLLILIISINDYIYQLLLIKSELLTEKRNIQTNTTNATNSTSNTTNSTNSTIILPTLTYQFVFKNTNVTTPPFDSVEIQRETINNTVFIKYDYCRDLDTGNIYTVNGKCENSCPVGYREISELKYCYRCNDYTKYFYRGNCFMENCPNNTITNEANKMCEECNWKNRYFFENKCFNKCDHFLAVDETQKLCINCSKETPPKNAYNYGTNSCISITTVPEGFGVLNKKFNVYGYCNRIGKANLPFTKTCLNKCYSLPFTIKLEEGIICILLSRPPGTKNLAYDIYDSSKRVVVSSCPKYTTETTSACNYLCPQINTLYFKNYTLVNETIKCLNETIYPPNILTNSTLNITSESIDKTNNTLNTTMNGNTTQTCIKNEINEDYIMKNEEGSFVNITKVTDVIISKFSCIEDKACNKPRVLSERVCLWNITEFCHSTNMCGIDSDCSMINTQEFVCHCHQGKEAYGFNCRLKASQYIEAKIKIESVMQKLTKITITSTIPLSLLDEIQTILPLINNFPSFHKKIYNEYQFVKKMISYFDQVYVSSKRELEESDIVYINDLFPSIIETCLFITKTMIYQVKSKDPDFFVNVVFFMEMINYMSLNNLKLSKKKENFNELLYKFLITNNTNLFSFSLNENTLNRHYLYREFYDIVDFDSCLLNYRMKYYLVFFEMKIDFSSFFKKMIKENVDLVSNPYFFSLLNAETLSYEGMDCPIWILSTLREKEDILTIDNQNNTLKMIKDLSINPMNLEDDFFTSDCYYYEKNGTFANMTINDRIKYYYKNLTLKIGAYDIRNKTFIDCEMEYIEKDKSFQYNDKFFFKCEKILASGWYFYYFAKSHYVDYNPLQTIFSQTTCYSKGLKFPDNLSSIWFYIINAILIIEVASILTYFLTYERTYEVNFPKIFSYDLDYFYYHLLPAMLIKKTKLENSINVDNNYSHEDDLKQKMELNIVEMFRDSKALQKGLITKNHISDILKNLPFNDICYNTHEIALNLDTRNILEYLLNVIYETNYLFITYFKFGLFIPGYIKIIAFFTYCITIYTLIPISNIFMKNRKDIYEFKDFDMYISFITSVIPSKILIFLLMTLVSPSEQMIIYLNKMLYEKIANVSNFHSLLFKKKAISFVVYLLVCLVIQIVFLSFLLNFNEINSIWRKPIFYYGSIYILIDIFGVNFCIVFIAFLLRFFTFSLKMKLTYFFYKMFESFKRNIKYYY